MFRLFSGRQIVHKFIIALRAEIVRVLLCRGHDLRCAMILLLLVSAAALWALSGLFLLPLPLAMALAWVWQRLCDRGAAVSAAVPAAVLALCAVSSILFMF